MKFGYICILFKYNKFKQKIYSHQTLHPLVRLGIWESTSKNLLQSQLDIGIFICISFNCRIWRKSLQVDETYINNRKKLKKGKSNKYKSCYKII